MIALIALFLLWQQANQVDSKLAVMIFAVAVVVIYAVVVKPSHQA